MQIVTKLWNFAFTVGIGVDNKTLRKNDLWSARENDYTKGNDLYIIKLLKCCLFLLIIQSFGVFNTGIYLELFQFKGIFSVLNKIFNVFDFSFIIIFSKEK